MNYKMVLNTVGTIVRIEAALLLLPLAVSLIYSEGSTAIAFLISALLCFAVGSLFVYLFRTKNTVIYARDGFAIVALAWLGMSAFGAIPFVICGDIPSYTDAFFETVSGFTTTGASILNDVESLSRGCLFWRSFTHWIGGMGVLVFVMALIPNLADRTIHIMRAEMPGPIVGKLVPRVKDTAKILYIIYVGLTVLEVLLLLLGGNGFYDSLVHTFGTAGTGGFGLKADSIAGYSPYVQWVIGIFMLVFGVNFNLYYLILAKRTKNAIKSTELWVYLGIALCSTMLIAFNIRSFYPDFPQTLRHAFFQVASILTTTGYSTADFDLWPSFSKTLLLTLMFIGGCAGSTAGGLKVSRIILLFKAVGREFKQLIRPRAVNTVIFEGKEADNKTVSGVCVYFVVYMLCFLGIFLLLGLEPFDLETNFSATAACFNNIGPGFSAVGPTLSYSQYSIFSKYLLSAAMLLGRLEIYPLLMMLIPTFWKRKGV